MKVKRTLLAAGVTVAALMLMVLVNPVPGHAQSATAMVVKIPFDFLVGSKGLPAGTYTVEKRGEALWINDGSGNNAAILTNAVDNRGFRQGNMLVFNRYHEHYFLSEARWSDYSSARGLIKSAMETRIASSSSSQPVTIAASVR